VKDDVAGFELAIPLSGKSNALQWRLLDPLDSPVEPPLMPYSHHTAASRTLPPRVCTYHPEERLIGEAHVAVDCRENAEYEADEHHHEPETHNQ